VQVVSPVKSAGHVTKCQVEGALFIGQGLPVMRVKRMIMKVKGGIVVNERV
jgi:hypothetical protein